MEQQESANTHHREVFLSDDPERGAEPILKDAEILIRKAFDDDFDLAVELLFRCYYAPLCNHAIRYVSSRQIAEDIVSEVFSSCYADRSFVNIRGSYRAYLFTSVRNRAFNYVRYELSRSIPIEKADDMILASKEQQPDEQTHYEEMYQDVENAIEGLPPRRRSIYIMHRIEGKKQEQIASELQISLKTVKEHMYQALMQIRKELRQKWAFAWLVSISELFV